MGMLKSMLPTVIVAAGVGAVGFALGGVVEPFVEGVTAEVYAAIGFALALGYGLTKEN